ncbi:MAG: RNA 2'-phosphotransferase [Planctomycetes bacterium]|nr:RNA 2'-phosphotransferase [Planctomycetota bacterium]
MNSHLVKTSRYLSKILRHQPQRIGLQLDAQGWADIDELLRLLTQHGRPLTRVELEAVVRDNDKQRFKISPDGQRIRASQGHSIPVDLDLPPTPPPDTLFHGTATHSTAAIFAEGLRPGTRRHVHLSRDYATAMRVGARHGEAVVLAVASGAMHAAGHPFFVADNGVWLTAHVPPRFLAPAMPTD